MRLMDCFNVIGLVTGPDGRRVTGARVLPGTDRSAAELVSADLVVDQRAWLSHPGMVGRARLLTPGAARAAET
jgi:hypothetical protein